MIPGFPELKTLEPGDRELFERHAGAVPLGTCECSFANLMIWRDFDRPAFTFAGGNLCVRLDPVVGEPFFLEPLGAGDVAGTVGECIRHTGMVSMASQRVAVAVGGNGYRIRPLPEHFDYVYRTKSIAELKGRRLDAKRNHIRRMQERYPGAEYIEIGKGDAAAALELFDSWSKFKKGSEPEGLHLPELAYTCQRDSVRRAFEYFDELGLMGGALAIDDAMAGFIIGSRLTDDMACAHLCYTRHEIRGAFPFILREACRKTFGKFEYVNLEQDMGLAGLRKNKLSFCPAKIEEKFEITEAG